MNSDPGESSAGSAPIKKQQMFLLSKLPVLAKTEVISNLNLTERIKLALTSKKMKKTVAFSKYKLKKCVISLDKQSSRIYMPEERLKLNCGTFGYVNPDEVTIIFQCLRPWIQIEDAFLENTVSIFQNILEICHCTNYGLDVSNAPVQEALSIPEFKNWKFIWIKRLANKEEVDMIMEHANEERSIETRQFPIDYTHENAFKFLNVDYRFAHWVRLEHLLSLKTRGDVNIGHNNFNNSDVNMVIKHWIKSPFDMFRLLTISTQWATRWDQTGLFDDIVVLKTVRNNSHRHIVIADSNATEREWKILVIRKIEHFFLLHARSIDKPVSRFACLSQEFAILQWLNEKKRLEQELELINYQIADKADNDELIAKKREITARIDKLSADLRKKGVSMVDGFMEFRQN